MSLIKKINFSVIFRVLILLIIPTIVFLLFLHRNNVHGSYYLASNSDPEYAYLMNSLLIVNGEVPFHIDHPGTTVQIIGAILIKSLNFNSSINATNLNVLQDPEKYIKLQNLGMLTIILITLSIGGIYIYKFTAKLLYSLIYQLSIFISYSVYVEFSRVRPENLLISIILIFSLILISLIKYDIKTHCKTYIIIFGIICGLGLVTKISFFPTLLIPLIIIPRLKNKIFFLIITVASFLIFTLPVISEYTRIQSWISRLTINSGQYGNGQATIIDQSTYFQNIIYSFSSNPIFSISVIISSCLLIYSLVSYKSKTSNTFFDHKILFSILITQFLGILVVSKHFAVHYLIPTLMLTGILVIYTIKILLQIEYLKKINNRIIYLFFSFLLTLFILYQYNSFNLAESASLLDISKSIQISNSLNSDYKDYTKIYYYSSSTKIYALNFGNEFARNFFSKELSKLYPNNYFYNIWNQQYYVFGKNITFEQILNQNNKIIFEGTNFEKYYKDTNYAPKINLKNVFDSNYESIYIMN